MRITWATWFQVAGTDAGLQNAVDIKITSITSIRIALDQLVMAEFIF